VKGLYKKARAGLVHDMTGVDDPYEPPEKPDIRVETVGWSPTRSAEFVIAELERLGWPIRAKPTRSRAKAAKPRSGGAVGRPKLPSAAPAAD
jgi:hypothetical protein